ncbi:alpha-L-rhamnosidase [Demequina phytophila]|uniref:alpha-L-rhamnosidase n=1 Tax=Demequina phytophila TaxID=1638981 RepID=UPI000A553171|nr:alpha-L-rhamnosidase [Demequina phytophila]
MTVRPTRLRVDGRVQPLGIGSAAPEFSWEPGVGTGIQDAWEVQVAAGPDVDDAALVWGSGKVAGSQPYGHVYAGPALRSTSAYIWRVRTWSDGRDSPTPWEASTFTTGVLDASLWCAAWVAGPPRGPKDHPTPVYLRGAADIGEGVVRATAHVSSLGWHRFMVNGADLTGPALVPRWTPLDHEVEYITYDVTAQLQTGANVFDIVVGDGRFRGSNGFENHALIYGDRLAGFMQMVVEFADGTERLIVTDATWTRAVGPIVESDPKTGERVDLRIVAGGQAPDSATGPVEVISHPRTLVAESVERVTQVDSLRPVSITRTRRGGQVVDFGQNFAGVVRLRLKGPAGSEVTLTHSEVLKRDGTLDVDYIHMSKFSRWYQRDHVVLDGREVEWQPWFTIHGFRYVSVEGLPYDLEPDDVSGIVMSTDLDRTGEFECSDARLNQLWRNVSWSLTSNFTDTSTDCPTRERAGWTGDIQVFSPTATMQVDAQSFLRRYLHNLAVEQNRDGSVPVVIPSGFSEFSGGPRGHLASAGTAAGWGDAAVLVPWSLYRYYGDRRVLEDQYASMAAWVDSCARRARERAGRSRRTGSARVADIDRYIVDSGFQFGEWLRPGEGPIRSAMDARRNGAVVATAYLEHSARILSQVSGIVGKDAEQQRYRELADHVREAWRARFVRDGGIIGANRQDDYVRALAFDLLDADERESAAARLVALIEKAGGHLGTGFLSTALLLPTLVDAGRADTAWSLLMETTSPSWLYQVEHGATTVWETWEGYGRSGKARMSHNHYALGAASRFLVERIAGLTPLEPGYRVIGVQPLVGGGLIAASAAVGTPYGRAESSWRIDGREVEHVVSIPSGATGVFRGGLDAEPVTLAPGRHVLRRPRVRG